MIVAEISLETMTPVHIGTGEKKRRGVEWLLSGNEVCVFDIETICDYLDKKGKLPRFLGTLSGKVGRPQIPMDEVRSMERDSNLIGRCKRRIPMDVMPSGSVNEFMPCIRDAMGTVFIPGSSLKGAITTALLMSICKRNSRLKSEAERLAQNLPRRRLPSWQLLGEAFRFVLGRENQNRKDFSHFSWARFLKVTDLYPDGEVQTRVYTVCPVHENGQPSVLLRGDRRTPVRVLVEAVPPGSTFKGKLIIDDAMIGIVEKLSHQNSPFKHPRDVVKALTAWFMEVILLELGENIGILAFWCGEDVQPVAPECRDILDKLEESYEELEERGAGESVYIKVGYAAGINGITLYAILSDRAKQSLMEEIYQRRRRNDYAGRVRRGFNPVKFPATRRVAYDEREGKVRCPLAWARLKVEEVREIKGI